MREPLRGDDLVQSRTVVALALGLGLPTPAFLEFVLKQSRLTDEPAEQSECGEHLLRIERCGRQLREAAFEPSGLVRPRRGAVNGNAGEPGTLLVQHPQLARPGPEALAPISNGRLWTRRIAGGIHHELKQLLFGPD